MALPMTETVTEGPSYQTAGLMRKPVGINSDTPQLGSSADLGLGLDTCSPCLGGRHGTCQLRGHRRKTDNKLGCLCSMCHPQQRKQVLADRPATRPVGGGAFTFGEARRHQKPEGITLAREMTGWVRNTNGRPKAPELGVGQVSELRHRWELTASPKGYDVGSVALIEQWKSSGLTWPQIEQVIQRKNVRQVVADFRKGKTSLTFKKPEVWEDAA